MSTQIIQATILVCDGCGIEVGTDGSLRTSMDARAFAYGQGWRFPPQVKQDGRESANTSDVCPRCLPAWTPVSRGATRGGRRLVDGTVRLNP